MANSALSVANVDFATIKGELKTYLENHYDIDVFRRKSFKKPL